MPSLASRAVSVALDVGGKKGGWSSESATRASIAARQIRPARYGPPRRLGRLSRVGGVADLGRLGRSGGVGCLGRLGLGRSGRLGRRVEVRVRTVHGWPVYEVVPEGMVAGRRALYLHGGAYIQEIRSQHWSLIAELAAGTGTAFTVPIYPLAPAGTAEEIVPILTEMAAGQLAEGGDDRTSIVGDSAGGGMALAVALQLRRQGLPPFRHTVLISPWLDINITRSPTTQRDPFLALPGLRVAGQLYQGALAADDPRVSPIHGDLAGLGPITLISGTHDVLNEDARRLEQLARAAGVRVDYHEVPAMVHVFPLYPIPEARQARALMRRVLSQ